MFNFIKIGQEHLFYTLLSKYPQKIVLAYMVGEIVAYRVCIGACNRTCHELILQEKALFAYDLCLLFLSSFRIPTNPVHRV